MLKVRLPERQEAIKALTHRNFDRMPSGQVQRLRVSLMLFFFASRLLA